MKNKENLITDALNEVLSLVIIGVDYASEIAKKTEKSIPVVFRQLDQLLNLNVISKERYGKKVVYSPNWEKISKNISQQISQDIKKYNKYIKEANNEIFDKKLLKEFNKLINSIDKSVLENPNKIVLEFFSLNEVKQIFSDFLKQFFSFSNKLFDFTEVSFQTTIDYFLESFGSLDNKERKEIISIRLKDESNSEISVFMKICRLRYIQKRLSSPSINFLKNL